MSSWLDCLGDALHLESEESAHPHAPEEQAHLFHTLDAGSCEVECLTLVNAIVQMTKPAMALETGTYHGLGTLAIAHALERNDRGRLVTVDIAEQSMARRRIEVAGLEERVDFVRSESTEFLRAYCGTPFDFAFLDSEILNGTRITEAEILLTQGLFRGYMVLHDTSVQREGCEPAADLRHYHCGLAGLARRSTGGLHFPFSRGLTILHFGQRRSSPLAM